MTIIPLASRAINFERVKPRCHVEKMTKAHIEAEKNLRGKEESRNEGGTKTCKAKEEVPGKQGISSEQCYLVRD